MIASFMQLLHFANLHPDPTYVDYLARRLLSSMNEQN